MTIRLGMVTIDTTDALALGSWWAEQTGGSVVAENDGWFVMVHAAEGSPLLGFQKVEDPTPGKNRVHLDLTAPDLDAEVARLVAAGAAQVADHTIEEADFRWVTLSDPDGNLFCVSGAHEAESLI